MAVDESQVREFLRRKGDHLHHREGQELEFKEQFSLSGLAEYFRDFAAFANNRGGYLIFGVTDRPRTATGLSAKSIDQFEKIDPERITGYLLEIFSGDIRWHQDLVEFNKKQFGAFLIEEAAQKPIIAKKDEGKDQAIRNGAIYYRYGGRTQKIQHSELERMIDRRVEQNNAHWLDLMSKIGRAGPANAAVLDTEKGLIEKDDARILVLDEELAGKIKFIKEGQFSEKKGATTLKLVGDVVPMDKVEVVKKVKENLTKSYPLSAMELVAEVQRRLPIAKQGDVWNAIADNQMKDNSDYSAYNFRNKKQEDEYRQSGTIPKTTPSIYNEAAVEFIVKVVSSATAKEKA
jgi:hypothetical protein